MGWPLGVARFMGYSSGLKRVEFHTWVTYNFRGIQSTECAIPYTQIKLKKALPKCFWVVIYLYTTNWKVNLGRLYIGSKVYWRWKRKTRWGRLREERPILCILNSIGTWLHSCSFLWLVRETFILFSFSQILVEFLRPLLAPCAIPLEINKFLVLRYLWII